MPGRVEYVIQIVWSALAALLPAVLVISQMMLAFRPPATFTLVSRNPDDEPHEYEQWIQPLFSCFMIALAFLVLLVYSYEARRFRDSTRNFASPLNYNPAPANYANLFPDYEEQTPLNRGVFAGYPGAPFLDRGHGVFQHYGDSGMAPRYITNIHCSHSHRTHRRRSRQSRYPANGYRPDPSGRGPLSWNVSTLDGSWGPGSLQESRASSPLPAYEDPPGDLSPPMPIQPNNSPETNPQASVVNSGAATSWSRLDDYREQQEQQQPQELDSLHSFGVEANSGYGAGLYSGSQLPEFSSLLSGNSLEEIEEEGELGATSPPVMSPAVEPQPPLVSPEEGPIIVGCVSLAGARNHRWYVEPTPPRNQLKKRTSLSTPQWSVYKSELNL